MWSIIVIFIILIFVSVELYFRYGRTGRLIRKIPGPTTFPIIGNMWSYFLPSEKMFIFQRSLQKLYGDVNQIHMMNIRFVNISNPNDIEKLLSGSQGSCKKYPYTYLTHWLGQGLLVSNGQKWSQRRKMLTKAFHFNILQKFFMTFVEQADDFIKRVEEDIGKERTDLFRMASPTTLRIMCESAMGLRKEDMDTLMYQYLLSLELVGECFTHRIGRGWLHLEPIFQLTKIARKQKTAVKNLHLLTNTIINKRRNNLNEKKIEYLQYDEGYEGNKKLAMLDLLFENEKSGVLDHQGIREEVDTFLFAGHDTTAIVITFMLMALANEPEIQDKVFAEIHQVLNYSDRSPTIEDLNQMKYLEYCIKESLRLYPSAPVIARNIEKEIVLGGYTVPADTGIYINIYDLHRRPDVFPDPERFIPERFLPENCTNRHPFAYIPFSAGSRNCIGQKFAMLEIKTIMSKLLRRFRLEPVTKPADIVFKADIVLRTTHPIYVKFCLRQ